MRKLEIKDPEIMQIAVQQEILRSDDQRQLEFPSSDN
jgi:hypothetical protein